MKTKKTYSFEASKTDEANRFILYFGPDNNHTDKELPGRIYTDGSNLFIDLRLVPSETEVFVYDNLGRLLLKQKLTGRNEHILNLSTDIQILIVNLKNPNGSLCRKLFWNGNMF